LRTAATLAIHLCLLLLPLQGFGADAARETVLRKLDSLSVAPKRWQHNLHIMAACGVEDPAAVMAATPKLVQLDHAAPNFLERRLLLQRHFGLTPAQLYTQHVYCLCQGTPEHIALRLRFLKAERDRLLVGNKQLVLQQWRQRQRALPTDEQPQYISLLDITRNGLFYTAAGVTVEQLSQFAAEHPTNPILQWAQAAAQHEGQGLDAVVPPQPAKQLHTRQRRAQPPMVAAAS
jgi:hypothetical protein